MQDFFIFLKKDAVPEAPISLMCPTFSTGFNAVATKRVGPSERARNVIRSVTAMHPSTGTVHRPVREAVTRGEKICEESALTRSPLERERERKRESGAWKNNNPHPYRIVGAHLRFPRRGPTIPRDLEFDRCRGTQLIAAAYLGAAGEKRLTRRTVLLVGPRVTTSIHTCTHARIHTYRIHVLHAHAHARAYRPLGDVNTRSDPATRSRTQIPKAFPNTGLRE